MKPQCRPGRLELEIGLPAGVRWGSLPRYFSHTLARALSLSPHTTGHESVSSLKLLGDRCSKGNALSCKPCQIITDRLASCEHETHGQQAAGLGRDRHAHCRYGQTLDRRCERNIDPRYPEKIGGESDFRRPALIYRQRGGLKVRSGMGALNTIRCATIAAVDFQASLARLCRNLGKQ